MAFAPLAPNHLQPELESKFANLQASEIDFHNDARWDSFVIRHPAASIYHHSGWLAALEEEYGRKVLALACADTSGNIHGVLPLMPTRGLPFSWGAQVIGRRLSSLPRTPVAGPLSLSEDAAKILLQRAAELAESTFRCQLQIKSMSSDLKDWFGGLARVPWKQTYVIDLPERADDFCFGDRVTRHRVKGAINRASKLGVRVRHAETEADLKAWYELHVETMRWHASIPRPFRFFAALWKHLHARGNLWLLLAEQQRAGRPTLLSGYLLLLCGATVHCYVNGRRRDQLGLHPNDILQWEAIQDSCRLGFRRYDFGEVEEGQEGLIAFKVKWGAKPIRSYRYYYPVVKALPELSQRAGAAQKVLQRLWKYAPLRVTTFVGDKLNRYL